MALSVEEIKKIHNEVKPPEKKFQEVTLAQKHEFPVSHDFHPLQVILGSNLFNFIIVLAVVIWLIKKANLSAAIVKIKNDIIEIINNIENERAVKRNHLVNIKMKVQNVNQEVQKIINEGEQVAKSLSENIITDANKQAEEVVKKAETSVENQKQVVSNEIMTKVTGAAFYVAEEHIKQAIDDRLHRKYIEEFIDNLDKIGN
jgi:F0F1-type ATP synthase membrane subunit b/b'